MTTVQNISDDRLDPQRTLGELVLEQPARARLFERLALDYCCGGQQTLADACAHAGVQLESLCAALETLNEMEELAGERAGADELVDWRSAPTAELCEHIVGVHHAFLRRSLPRTGELSATVARVHGGGDPSVHAVQAAFERIRTAMEPHLASEEDELFPQIIAADQGGPAVAEEILAEHEHEHADVGAALGELRELTHGYDRERAHCGTHRALLDALEALEQDLHRHVHEENNVLFKRARAGRA